MASTRVRRLDVDELEEFLTGEDEEQLAAVGLSLNDVQAQIERLRDTPPRQRIERACRPGDGIRQIGPSDAARLLEAHRAAARRITHFVPASGAASRMFRDLHNVRRRHPRLDDAAIEQMRQASEGDERTFLEFLARINDFAFSGLLRARMQVDGLFLDAARMGGDRGQVLEYLLTARGLGFGELPKGLVPFHRYADGSRTAIEEHLVDALASLAGTSAVPHVHFTVAPQHRRRIVQHLEAAAARLARDGRGPRIESSVSVQSPATSMVAIDDRHRPVRDVMGRLVLRPGGHGALLANLEALGADIVFVRNVDNIGPDWRRDEPVRWQRLLIGLLVELQAILFAHLRRLERGDVGDAELESMERFAARELGLSKLVSGPQPLAMEARSRRLRRLLSRPLRVCGMVPDAGEPGGGPYWVRGADGTLSPQIVEAAQIDQDSEEQCRRFADATHFNPVYMACGLRDHRGAPHGLAGFADRDAYIVTRKSDDGRSVRVLELPGLWNGGMARWNTVFVEVPAAVFTPVKTVLDLLRPDHRAFD